MGLPFVPGDVLYYKYADRWGSPIETAVYVRYVPLYDLHWVRVGSGERIFTGARLWGAMAQESMLCRTPQDAAAHAKARVPDDSGGVYAAFNREVLRSCTAG